MSWLLVAWVPPSASAQPPRAEESPEQAIAPTDQEEAPPQTPPSEVLDPADAEPLDPAAAEVESVDAQVEADPVAADTDGGEARAAETAEPSDTARLGRPRRPPQATDDEQAGSARARDSRPPDETPWFPIGPGWSPIISVGYLAFSAPSDGPRPFLAAEHETGISHGLTTSALFPLIATGDRDAAWRLALTVGGGFDFARLEEPVVTLDEVVVVPGGGPLELARNSHRRQYFLYAAVGATLRFRRGGHGALLSAHWIPAREWGPRVGARLDRMRLSIGWTFGWTHVALVIGRTRDSVYTSWGTIDLRPRAHAGLTVGTGW